MVSLVFEDRHRYLLLSVVVLAGLAATFGVCVDTAEAQETAEEAVEIEDADDLQELREDLEGDYILVDDIDLSGTDNFEPIGGVGNASHVPEDSPLTEDIEVDNTPPFNGTFDGDGHEIAGKPSDERQNLT